MTTLEKFNADFKKFKESRAEFQHGKFTAAQLQQWQNEFLNLKLAEARQEGRDESCYTKILSWLK